MMARAPGALVALGIFALSLALVVAGIKFLAALGSAGIIILAAILVAYLMLPAVRFLQRYMPAGAAIAITYVVAFTTLAAVLYTVVPPLVDQAQAFIVSTPTLITRLTAAISDPHNRLFARLPAEVRAYLVGLPAQTIRGLSASGVVIARHTFGVLLTTVSLALSLLVVPILAAYLFFDTKELRRAALGLVPERGRAKALALSSDLSDTVGAYVRGQLLDGAIVGAMIAVMLWALHVPYALLIGVAAGLLNLVPYLGAIAGFVPSVALALAYNGWQNALIVALLFGVIQQIDGTLILPRIMKANVSLSPVAIIVSILVASALFGVVGTFLAVPVAALLRVLKVHFAPAPPANEVSELERQARALVVTR